MIVPDKPQQIGACRRKFHHDSFSDIPLTKLAGQYMAIPDSLSDETHDKSQ